MSHYLKEGSLSLRNSTPVFNLLSSTTSFVWAKFKTIFLTTNMVSAKYPLIPFFSCSEGVSHSVRLCRKTHHVQMIFVHKVDYWLTIYALLYFRYHFLLLNIINDVQHQKLSSEDGGAYNLSKIKARMVLNR